MERICEEQDVRPVSEYNGLHLRSAYQPVYSIAHRRQVGHEALLRAFTVGGNPVPPPEVFAMAKNEAEITQLDRLCRTLHVCNYVAAGPERGWLFLNVNPTVVVHGKNYGAFFSRLLEQYALPPYRIVVEILEGAIHDEAELSEAVAYYRELGCLVAIDDFGSGHSNFDRIWRLSPDIVKLDRSVIVHSTSNKKARRLLPGMVSLLHETGCLVLTEGVETEDEALNSMDADVDFVQGYYFGRPATSLDPQQAGECHLTDLCGRFKREAEKEATAWDTRNAPAMASLLRSAKELEMGIPLGVACSGLITEKRVERCYLLDAEGAQIGMNLVASVLAAKADPRFASLEDSSGARWFRRPYFRRAIARLGRVRISRPYLSLTGAHMCVTLSVGFHTQDGIRVLCCDLNAEAL